MLPISGGAITGVKLSDGGNCIGKFNPLALNNDCSDNYQNCSKWLTDGSLKLENGAEPQWLIRGHANET